MEIIVERNQDTTVPWLKWLIHMKSDSSTVEQIADEAKKLDEALNGRKE